MKLQDSRLLYLLWLCVLINSCGSTADDTHQLRSEGKGSSPIQSTRGTQSRCLLTIEQYVYHTRGWDRSTYDVSPEQFAADFTGFAVHKKSESTFVVEGGRKSFHVDLDKTCSKVLREQRYQ